MDVRTIEDGEIITEPGAYRMSIEHYHAQCTDGPSISSTGIRQIILKSPAAYWKESALNPARAQQSAKAHFSLGKASHTLLLGEAGFKRDYAVLEDWPDFRTKAAQEWRDAQEAAGRTVLTLAQIDQIRGMAGLLPWQRGMDSCGLANTPLIAQAGALSGEIELSLFFEQDGIFLKSRPDVVPNSSGDFVDLKTISPKSDAGLTDWALRKEIYSKGYFIQGALVGMAARNVLGIEMKSFNFVFVDTGNVHDVVVRSLTEEDIIRGERAIYAALSIFRRCLATGRWPGRAAEESDANTIGLDENDRKSLDLHLDRLEQEIA